MLNNPSAPSAPDPGPAPQLSIVLPAYGEADNLRLLLPKIRQVISDLQIPAQVCVIDAMETTDDTEAVCWENRVEYSPRQGSNRYGDAIRTGIAKSAGEYVVIMDSDGSHDPEFIKRLWEKRLSAEVVIASRYVPGGATDNPWLLVEMSRVLNIVFHTFVRLPVYDVSNSFRLYRGDLLRGLTLQYQNFDILEEILAKLVWSNPAKPVRVVEVPFHFIQRMYGKPKRKLFVFGFQFLTALFKLQLLRFKYQRQS